jgi:hypothetical protein
LAAVETGGVHQERFFQPGARGLGRPGHREEKLDQAVVEKGRAHFEAVGHAHLIDVA